jgi:transposase
MSKRKRHPTNWKEQRRLHALELKRRGWKQKDIAMGLNVGRSAVSQWLCMANEQGRKGLYARPHTGRPPALTDAEKGWIPDFLSHGAEAYGFRGDVWTCARVGKVIEMEFGVSYHKGHIARLLKELKWTPPQPIERATQRDESEIARWRRNVWREMKKKPVWSTESLFLWMNRASISCPRSSALMRRVARHPFCEFSKPVTICP